MRVIHSPYSAGLAILCMHSQGKFGFRIDGRTENMLYLEVYKVGESRLLFGPKERDETSVYGHRNRHDNNT